MRAEQRARAEDLFHRLASLEPQARVTLLAEIAGEDPAVAAEVESLLAAHDSDGVLDRLTAEIAPEPFGPHGPSRSSDTLSGTSIEQYEIGELIGRGGMGDVYRARDTKLGRDVALKFLPAWLSGDPSARDRFVMEARVVSSIDHTNVCALHDLGETDDGRLYLIMPYYHGDTLKQRLAAGPLPAGEAIRIALQTARGLAAAHERGIVHRDIKPANLLLTGAGGVKILDFGVAKLADVALTRTGQTPGTASYMSPEQAAGDDMDARSDLWSLGAVLYEMLTGRRPAREPERIAAGLASVPRGLAEIVSRLLAFSPDDRYPDARSLAQDLGALAKGTAPDAHPAPGVRRILADFKRRSVLRAGAVYGLIAGRPATQRWPIVMVGAVAGALIVAAAWFALGDRRSSAGSLSVTGDPRSGARSLGVTGDAAPGVAVLPFRTVGKDIDWLREGIVVLLSFNFDGVRGLRKIDPTWVMSTWDRTVGEGRETDPDNAVAVADSLGASYAVAGNAVQVGDQGEVSLVAIVYDVRTGNDLGSAQVTGHLDSIFSLIDRLTIEILRLGLIPTDTGSASPNVARVSTSSLPALKAYLSGEWEYRRGNWAAATVHFREAVRLDSMFARAFYRLGWAMMGAGLGRVAAQDYLERAATLGTKLPVRDSLLLSIVGSPAASEAAVRRLTTEYPDDADGWHQMGEVLFHAGSGNFWPPAEYRDAFERAIALAPNNAEPYTHLLEDAFARLDSARIRSLLGASAGQVRFCYGLIYDLRWGEDVDRRRALAALDTMPDDTFGLNGSCGQTFFAPADKVMEAAERAGLARLRSGSRLRVARVALGQLTTAHLYRGEVSEAREIVALADVRPEFRNVANLDALTARMSPYSDESVASAVTRLEQRIPGESAPDRTALWLALYAMARSRASDFAAALQELETQAAGTDSTAARAGAYAEVLRTYAAVKQGDLDQLRAFEAAQRFFPELGNEGEFLRYDVGLLLLKAGRLDDASRYFLSLYPDTWYYVPAQYRLGQIYERLGERELAREHYRIFVEWWNNADPELQPRVDEGRAALARMGG